MIVDTHPARFKILACGRRWGKTRYGTHKCLRIALAGGNAWWIAPSYKVAAVGWRGIKELARQIPASVKGEVERIITFPNGGTVQVRSADDPDSLRGVGLDFVVIDEAAFVAEAAWNEALRPALADREGHALIISTPKGRNWFWHAYQRGLDPLVPDWMSWSFPTVSNPYINPLEVESARSQLPEDIFRQEFLAEFLENAGTVFRNLAACMNAPMMTSRDEHLGHHFVMGADWGKQDDFTALSVGCLDCQMEVAHDRFNQIDYQFQLNRLAALADYWRVGTILAESNAMGEPIIDVLRAHGLPMASFETTGVTKPPLIESLALSFEREEWQFQDDPIWTTELEAYERHVNPYTGRSQYSAPNGLHDDTVMARALMREAAGHTYEDAGGINYDKPYQIGGGNY